jgi:hypothetical protein
VYCKNAFGKRLKAFSYWWRVLMQTYWVKRLQFDGQSSRDRSVSIKTRLQAERSRKWGSSPGGLKKYKYVSSASSRPGWEPTQFTVLMVTTRNSP